MKRILHCLLAAVLLVLLSAPALAAGRTGSVALPVSQTVPSGQRSGITVRYTLSARSADAPMPEGAEKGSYRFSLTNESQSVLPTIAPAAPGEWTYTLSASAARGTVSPSSVEITITAEETPEGLATYAVCRSGGEKCDLAFAVTPQSSGAQAATPAPKPKSASTPKTGDGRPLHVLQLLLVTSGTITLTAWALYAKSRRADS